MTRRSATIVGTCFVALLGLSFLQNLTGARSDSTPHAQARLNSPSALAAAQRMQQERVIDVRSWGAVGDGVTDDTAVIQTVIEEVKGIGGGIVYFPSGTYLATVVDCRGIEKVTIVGSGNTSTIKRRSFSGTGLLLLGSHGVVCGICLDGNKVSATGSPGKGDHGLVAADDCVIDHVTSIHNYGQGFRADGSCSYFVDCNSASNGMNPGARGTGDGFYVGHPHTDNMFKGCMANRNARSGFVITSNGKAGCYRNKILACSTDGGNGYNEINLEGSTDSVVRDCTIRGLLIFNRAVRPQILNNALVNGTRGQGGIYARDTTESWVVGNQVEAGDDHERICVSGLGPAVKNNSVRHSLPPRSGYSILVGSEDASDTAIVVGNSVYNGCRGIYATGVKQFFENRTDGLADASRSIGIATTAGHMVSSDLNVVGIEIRDGHGIFRNLRAPVTGSFVKGDICRGTAATPEGSSAWLCVDSGTPGEWITTAPAGMN